MTIQERAEKAVELKNSGRCNCALAWEPWMPPVAP